MASITSTNIRSLAAMALFGLASTHAHAASISLTPLGDTNILVGESVTFQIWADFGDTPPSEIPGLDGGTDGGGFDISFNAAVLSYNGDIDFNPIYDDLFTYFTYDGDVGSGIIKNISINSFAAPLFTTPTVMATLSFTGIGAGVDVIEMDTTLGVGGVWVWSVLSCGNLYPPTSQGCDGVVDPLDYFGATVQVSPVPVPAAAWLMAGGLGMLGGFIRRKASA